MASIIVQLNTIKNDPDGQDVLDAIASGSEVINDDEFDISRELYIIRNPANRYGIDIRMAIHDALKKLQDKTSGGGGGGGICSSDVAAISPGFILRNITGQFEYPPPPDDCPFAIAEMGYFVDAAVGIGIGDRGYTKVNAHYAVGMIVYLNVGYTIPLFMSPIEDAVGFTYNETALGSFDYDGVTWYYSGSAYAMGGDLRSTATGLQAYPDPVQWVNNDYVASNLVGILSAIGVTNKEVS